MNKIGKKNLRRSVQIFFFLLIGAIAVNKTLTEAGFGIPLLSTASLHALCPFGGVVTLYNLATLGTFVQKIHMSAVVLMGVVLVLAILFGPVFCGWVCPLGSIQEWIGKLGRKMLGRKYNRLIPERSNRWLSYLRYVVLVWVIYVTARSGYLIFANVDPYNALFTFWSEEVALPSILILVATLAVSLFIERPWCRFLCPYGALLGLFNKVRIFKLRRSPSTCIDCGRCDQVCPMNIDISHKDVISDTLCISCLECTSERHCPVPATVTLQTGAIGAIDSVEKTGESAAKTLRIPLMAVLILAVFFAGIVTTMALGIWTTESEKNPSRYTDGIAVGEYDPSDIRGSYTFLEVSDLFGIPITVLYEAFGLPESADPAVMQTKMLEELYGEIPGPDGPAEIGNESVQVFVALYKGLPITLVDTWLPTPAVDLLLAENPDLTTEQREYLSTHNVALPALDEGSVLPEGETIVPEPEESTEPLVNGNTTIRQLLDAGLTTKQLEEILGPDLPLSNMKVKEYCTQQGLAFSEVKAQLLELLAEKP